MNKPQRPWWWAIVVVLVSAVVLAVGLFAYAWKHYYAVAPSTEYSTAGVTIGGVHLRVRVPLTEQASERGLGGVTSLSNRQGMLWYFQPASKPTFWMKGMKIGLDFIWIRQGDILSINEQVPPPSSELDLPIYQPPGVVDNVLEVPAGFAAEHHLQVGDPVVIDPERLEGLY